MNIARVHRTGTAMAYQDTGRSGWRRFGVPPGGVMDGHAAALANTLLANPSTTTLIEFTLHGAEIEFLANTWVSLTGACSSSLLESGSARRIHAGELIKLEPTRNGIWSYLAIPGGWVTQEWFGSTSTYARAGMGERIQNKDYLVGQDVGLEPFDSAIANRFAVKKQVLDLAPPKQGFPIFPGPQYDSFPAASKQSLVNQTWRVSPQSDRSGFRLEGKPLIVAPDITSEAVLPGSFQVPGNGRPIITMPDGPTVGGYPKIAYMEQETLWQLAQCQPGSQISFRWAT